MLVMKTFLLVMYIITQVYKKNDQNARNITPIYIYVFGVTDSESGVGFFVSGHVSRSAKVKSLDFEKKI